MAVQERIHERLPPEIFDLPVEKMREGYYADAYFNHARATLLQDERHPRVVMQVFQKRDAYLGRTALPRTAPAAIAALVAFNVATWPPAGAAAGRRSSRACGCCAACGPTAY